MMEPNLNSADVNEKICDRNDIKPTLDGSLTTASKSHIIPGDSTAAATGPFTGITSYSDEISTEDPELSSTDISLHVLPNKTIEASLDANLRDNPIGVESRAVSICDLCSVEKHQPKPLCAILPSSREACTVYEVSQSFTSLSRKPQSVKTTTVNIEPRGDDLCAAILLACLFCHPLECLLATMSGCNRCVWSLCSSLCSSLCGCEPPTLQSLQDTIHRDLCGGLGVRCFLCDCPICDICIQASECLDLAMEISQMLYH